MLEFSDDRRATIHIRVTKDSNERVTMVSIVVR